MIDFFILIGLFYVFLKFYPNRTRKNQVYRHSNMTFVPYSADPPPNLHLFHNNKVLIYKAFQDIRYNQIRILGAMYLNLNMSFIIIKVNGKVIKYKREVHGLVISFNIQFPLKYVNFVFPYMPISRITVNDIEIDYIPVNRVNYKHNFTVCISSIKNKFTAKTILDQTLNIYQKEGVSHAIIYYGDISKEVYDVLDKYVKSGFLEIFYWPQLEILSYIRNYGQILKMNDCFYRSYSHSRYVVNSDMDEIIMPKTFYTLIELINSYRKKNPRCGQFQFYNKYFKKNNSTDKTKKYGRKAYYHLPPVEDCDLFRRIYACNETLTGKYIISTKKALALRFHDAVTLDVKCRIHYNDGHVRHTRVIYYSYTSSICKILWLDDTILKYK